MIVSLMLFISVGCFYVPNDSGYYDDDGSTYTYGLVTYRNLFPFENGTNMWHYTDEDGNAFSISVVDTISDEQELYFKVAFVEEKIGDSQDDWFVRVGTAVEFNEHLRGEYLPFLPSSFSSNGGTFYSDGMGVRYTLFGVLTIGGKQFRDVVRLEYDTAVLHGFDRVYFSEGIGIIALADDDGRWPIEYVLDYATIAGVSRSF